MVGAKVFLQSRHALTANLALWILTAIADVYYVAMHFRSLDLIKLLTAGLYLCSAGIFVRLAIRSLRAGEDE